MNFLSINRDTIFISYNVVALSYGHLTTYGERVYRLNAFRDIGTGEMAIFILSIGRWIGCDQSSSSNQWYVCPIVSYSYMQRAIINFSR